MFQTIFRSFLVGLFILSSSFSSFTLSCTTFADQKNLILGKNFDWNQGQGFLVSNKKGWSKKSLVAAPQAQPLRWESKYNSITFNLLGLEFPNNGVNEAGLSVEILWLNDSEYPQRETLPATNELQWIQYQLDTAATVEEAITNAKNIWLYPFVSKIHYFICDYNSCATFSYQKQKLVINRDLKIKALANTIYSESLTTWESGDQTQRFSILASYLSENQKPMNVDEAFKLLEKVHLKSNQWRIVFDKAQSILNFKIAKDGLLKLFPYQKTLQEGTCRDQQTQYFNLSQAVVGDISNLFSPLSDSINEALVDQFDPKLAPAALKRAIKNLPKTFTCL